MEWLRGRKFAVRKYHANFIRLKLLDSRVVIVGSLLYPAFWVGFASRILDVRYELVQRNATTLYHP